MVLPQPDKNTPQSLKYWTPERTATFIWQTTCAIKDALRAGRMNDAKDLCRQNVLARRALKAMTQ